jgi:hypothetical protein
VPAGIARLGGADVAVKIWRQKIGLPLKSASLLFWPWANQEQAMRHDLDLVMERESVLRGLFEATFGRVVAAAAAIGRVIFRLGTVDGRPNED